MRCGAPRRADDDGAYLILYALLAVALFTLGAVVLDIAALRQDRTGDRLAADLAATAGASQLDRAVPATTRVACEDAWAYFVDNVEAVSPIAPPDCATAFPPIACTDATPPATVVGTAGPYRVEITSPVPEGSSLMDGEISGGDRAQPADPVIDGHQCDRLAVRVLRERSQPFSGIVGLGARTTDVHSVARSATTVASGQITELVVLDPAACSALRTENTVMLDVAGAGQTGDIAADSDATGCGGSGYVIDVANSSDLQATSGINPGVIRSRALTGPFPTAAFDVADVNSGRLSPEPSPAAAATGRGSVDLRYNCTSTACPPGQDHIDRLRAEVGAGMPASYLGVPVLPYTGPCDATDPTVIPAGNWYVACPVFQISSDVTFEGGLLVVQGGLNVVSGGCFAVGDGGCGALIGLPIDSIIYLQSGDLVAQSNASTILRRTFVHLTGAAATLGSGRMLVSDPDTAVLTWTAPVGGSFEDLALWAEGGDAMHLEGRASSTVEGVVFAPHSEVRMTPMGGAATLATQVFAGRFRATGSGRLTLSPGADRAVSNTARSVRLLR